MSKERATRRASDVSERIPLEDRPTAIGRARSGGHTVQLASEWSAIMRQSIAVNASFFNTQRMLRQYALPAYSLEAPS